jgi:WXG100 family type VII secretion target
MSLIISIKYDGMQSTAQQFEEAAGKVKKMQGEIQQQIDVLKKGSWLSEAANRWYGEMDNDVLPGVQRLHEAYMRSSQVCREIGKMMEQAEEEAGNVLPNFA